MEGTIMHIQIHLDADTASGADVRILRALADAVSGDTPGVVIQMADAKAAQASASEDVQEEAKAAPKPRGRKAAAPKAAPEPQADATDSDEDIREMERQSDEDLLGDAEPTVDDAVKRATDLVEEGKGGLIKKALAKAKADKVRNLTDEGVVVFLDALKDA